jgi:hypothetical protein
MTAGAQFYCITSVRTRILPAKRAKKANFQGLAGPTGALRETTQSRKHDPTAQPTR